MSAFKDCVKEDLSDVFFNMDEFAETHDLNGAEIVCVVSIDKTAPRSDRKENSYDGLHGNFVTLFVKVADMDRIPKQGENFKLDKKLYKVNSCREDMGMLSIVLAAYRMGGAG